MKYIEWHPFGLGVECRRLFSCSSCDACFEGAGSGTHKDAQDNDNFLTTKTEGCPLRELDEHLEDWLETYAMIGRNLTIAAKIQADLLKPILSSITAPGPTGTRPGLGRSSFRKAILSRQTLRRKSSNTWIVNCSPGQRL